MSGGVDSKNPGGGCVSGVLLPPTPDGQDCDILRYGSLFSILNGALRLAMAHRPPDLVAIFRAVSNPCWCGMVRPDRRPSPLPQVPEGKVGTGYRKLEFFSRGTAAGGGKNHGTARKKMCSNYSNFLGLYLRVLFFGPCIAYRGLIGAEKVGIVGILKYR